MDINPDGVPNLVAVLASLANGFEDPVPYPPAPLIAEDPISDTPFAMDGAFFIAAAASPAPGITVFTTLPATLLAVLATSPKLVFAALPTNPRKLDPASLAISSLNTSCSP